MNITEDSFIGKWKGGPENGMSLFTVELKKENDNLCGIFTVDGISGNEVRRAMEIPISSPRFSGNAIRFKPNPGRPGVMAMELINENEAAFGSVIDMDDIEKHFDQIAKATKDLFGVTPDRSIYNPQSPETIAAVKAHTVKLIKQAAVN